MSAKPKDAKAMPKILHVRRCHVCGTVNESEGVPSVKCSDCGKHLAPFFYFDPKAVREVPENKPFFSVLNQSPTFHPVWGIAVYWD